MAEFYRDKNAHECIRSLFGSEHEEESSQIKDYGINPDIKSDMVQDDQDAQSEADKLLSDIRNPDLSATELLWTIIKLAAQMTILFFMDVFLLFPLYYGIMVFECFTVVKKKYQKDSEKDYKKYLQITLRYYLDTVLPGCVFSITLAMVLGMFLETDPIYYFWQKNCFYFFIAFNLLATYSQMQKDAGKPSKFACNLSYIMRQEHLVSMGLGGLHTKFLTELDINELELNEIEIENSQQEQSDAQLAAEIREKGNFFNRIGGISKELNIDLSLFYFSMFDQNYYNEKRQEQMLQKREGTYLRFLEENGETTKLSGRSDILWPSYKQSNSIWKEDSVPILVYICVVLVKVVLPLWYMKNDKDVEIKFVELFNITGFYVYLIGILYLTLRNEDLEQRNSFMRRVNDLVDFEDCQSTNNRSHYFSEKLDVTCTTSLECWDNARRIGCMLDKKKTIRFEASCVFLSFYYIFTAIVCVSIYSEIYILFDENSIYMHPVMVIQTTFDFLMITAFFFVRLNYGSTFNANFPEQVELVDKLTAIYEDIIQSYDLYFADGFVNKVQNNLYQKIIQKIREKSERYTKVNMDGKKIQYRGVDYTNTNGKILMISIMQLNTQALDKIRKQIIRDQEQHKHLLFGVFDLPFKETLTTALLFFLTLTPTIFKKLESTFNPNAHPAPAPAQIHHLHRD